MKEAYFTLNNICEKSMDMLQTVERYRRRHKIDFKLNEAALLITDMQKYFLNKTSHAYIPSAEAIIPNIKSLINLFIKNNSPVILTRHIDFQSNSNLMLKWWRGSIEKEDELSKLIADFNELSAIIIEKTQYDAFYKTTLEDLLLKRGISQLVITGVMTHLCCETTARAAFVRGFTVFFPIDATATYNEEFHRATLLNLSHGFAIPVLSKELYNLSSRGENES
jgi:isochorismate hydrolase